MQKGVIMDYRKLKRVIEIIGWTVKQASDIIGVNYNSMKKYTTEDCSVSWERYREIEAVISDAFSNVLKEDYEIQIAKLLISK
jgi:hypothetical protein